MSFRAVLLVHSLLAAQNADQLKELEKATQQASHFEYLKQVPQAIQALERKLALERELHGKEDDRAAQTMHRLGRLRARRGEYESAKTLCKDALAILRKHHPEKHHLVIDARLALEDVEIRARLTAEQRETLRQADDAEALADKRWGERKTQESLAAHQSAVAGRRRVLGDNHPDIAETYRAMARTVQFGDNETLTATLHTQALAVLRAAKGNDHPDTAASLIELAFSLDTSRNHNRAAPHFEEALRIQTNALGEEHPDTVRTLRNLAMNRLDCRRLSEAQPLIEKAFTWTKKHDSKDGSETRYFRSSVEFRLLGLEIPARRQLDDRPDSRALELLESILPIRAAVFGEKHYSTIDVRLAIADARKREKMPLADSIQLSETRLFEYGIKRMMAENRMTDALATAKTNLRNYRRILGEDHHETAQSMNTLALIHQNLAEFSEARPLYEKALAITRTVKGEDHPHTGKALGNLASLLKAQGFFAESRAKFEEALALFRRVLGEDHFDTGGAWNNTATACSAMGDYVAARRHAEKAIEVFEKCRGKDDPATANAVNSLGYILHLVGDLPGAQAHYERALEIRKKKSTDRGDVANSHINLGGVCNDRKDRPGARFHYEQALVLMRKARGDKHPDVALILHNLGSVCEASGDLVGARKYLNEALEIHRTKQGEDHVNVSRVLIALGHVAFAADDSKEARRCYERALEIRRKAQGDSHPQTATALMHLGLFLSNRDELKDARRCFEEALATRLKLTADLLPTLAEVEALAYIESTETGRDPLLSVLRRLGDVAPEQAYRAVWDTRGLAGRAVLARRPPSGAGEAVAAAWERLRNKRSELARVTLAETPPTQVEARRIRLAKLSEEKETLERRLAELTEAQRGRTAIPNADFTDLARRLQPGVALVEFVRIEFWGPAGAKRERHYEAFVLRSSMEKPGYSLAWIHLGDADAIDKLVESWRESIVGTRKPADAETPEKRLRSLVWSPIESRLDGCTSVVVVPDAGLTAVPWAALPGRREGTYLIEDHLIAGAASGRQLLDVLTREPTSPGPALVVGGVKYDALDRAPMPTTVAHRGPIRDGERQVWGFLQGTRDEASAIRGLWPEPGSMSLLEGDSASKSALRQAMPKARYVHLATHGFFADPRRRTTSSRDATPGELGDLSFGRATPAARNPLLLSGLVLAGANLPSKAEDEDGIMTAEEVVELDLRRTDLVVLSACETGLGAVTGGEGVFGLQRAFALAGARTSMAGLWKVDDRATALLMTRFYENLWTKKMGPAQALRHAQVSLLRNVEQSGATRGFAHIDDEPSAVPSRVRPALWAAWTLNGDPGDLTPIDLPEPVEMPYDSPTFAEPTDPWNRIVWGTSVVVVVLLVVYVLRMRSSRRGAAG